MKQRQYALAVYQPDWDPREVRSPIMTDLYNLAEEMQAADVWVFSVGLHPASTATVVRDSDGGAQLADGPFSEVDEHLSSFTVINAPDLDVALRWGFRMARTVRLPVEVRPIA